MDGNENKLEDDLEEDGQKIMLHKLEEEVKVLTKEKQDIEQDFGQKRAKYRELFLQKEEELKREVARCCASQQEKEHLLSELRLLQRELEEARSQVTIAEYTKENDIEMEKEKCEEQIASLHQLLKEAVEEASSSRSQYEGEVKMFRDYTSRLEVENQALKEQVEAHESILGPGVLTAVTKSLARKVGVGNLNPSAPTSSESLQSLENLEDSMKKAQEDAEVLRSLVVPLEEEIVALKEKLRQTDEELRMYEKQQAKTIKGSEAVGELLKGKSCSVVVSELDDKLKELSNDLQAEKSSRADLEMYVAILNTQKTVLQEDCEKIRTQLHEMCHLLECEKRAHNELKYTWQRANDQFLESQRLQFHDMQRMQSVLTVEQQRQIAAIQKQEEKQISRRKQKPKEEGKDQSDASGKEEMEKELTTTEGKESLAPSMVLGRLSPAFQQKSPVPQDDEKSEKPDVPVLNGPDSLAGDSAGSTADEMDGTALSRDASFNVLCNIEADSMDISCNSSSGLLGAEGSQPQKWSPENMPGLTDDQHKALADLTPELEARKALVDGAKSSYTDVVIPSGKRLVSEKEWTLLQEELRHARDRLGRPCDMCLNYEAQLQKVQQLQKETDKQKQLLEKTIENYKEDLAKESKFRKDMEEKWNENAEEHKNQVKDVHGKLEKAEKTFQEVQQSYNKAKSDIQQELKLLTEKREHVQHELIRLQKENDVLMGKHSAHAEQLQNEIINLPDNMEDMQELLLCYKEDLITAKVAEERTGETLKSEILFLKDEMSMTQQEKDNLIDNLTSEIDTLREQLGITESIKSQLELEQKQKAQCERALRETQGKLVHMEARSKQITMELQRQLEEQNLERAKLKQEIIEQKNKVSTLQMDLGNSEAVQKDFVRLSQSLQVELEKIRQSEKEVRWQYEEDVEDCNDCKQSFSVTKRKHHCRHCGRIFCLDCLSKSVLSGPNQRASRVCDVCHTLLVQHSAPYFSSEPPHTPD